MLHVKQQLKQGKLSLGLLLGTEAPVMMPNGADFPFLVTLSLMMSAPFTILHQSQSIKQSSEADLMLRHANNSHVMLSLTLLQRSEEHQE